MYQVLYHPHIGEVFPIMLGLRQKFKNVVGLAERSIKSEQMLLNHDIFWDNGWYIPSQMKKGVAYRVNGNCECDDKGVLLNGQTYCKHKIAVHSYQKILGFHLNNLAEHRIRIDEEFQAQWNQKLNCFAFPSEEFEFKFSQWLVIDGGKHECIKQREAAGLRAGMRTTHSDNVETERAYE